MPTEPVGSGGSNGRRAGHGRQAAQHGEQGVGLARGQVPLRGRDPGVGARRCPGQLAFVGDEHAVALLGGEDLWRGEGQWMAGDVRVDLAHQVEAGRRPFAPHLGDQALAEPVDGAFDACGQRLRGGVTPQGEVRELVVVVPLVVFGHGVQCIIDRSERTRTPAGRCRRRPAPPRAA
jgi:hypothetical protein